MTSGTQIFAAQYVTIQDKAQSLMGTGSETRGYGQTVQSADVFSGNAITKAQWDLLRYDIVNIRVHQTGTLPNIATIAVGDPIGYGASSPNTNYDSLLEIATSNRFFIDASQSVVTAKTSATSAWSTSLTATLTITFSNSNEARYFFNSGGKVRFTTSLTGGTVTPQYTAWVNILNSIGTRSFGADTDPFVSYYTLTNTFQTYYTSFASSPYSNNSYILEARTDVANNNTGTATQLFLRVTLADTYVDPDVASGASFPPTDSVNGTLTIAVSELKAAGSLQPSGSFAITSPTYSLSAIAGS